MYNKDSLDTLCAALAYAMGIKAPEHAAEPNKTLTGYIDQVLQDQKAERVFIYNPDAVAQWITEPMRSMRDWVHMVYRCRRT